MQQSDLFIFPNESDIIVPEVSSTRIITYTPSASFIIEPESPQTNIVVSAFGMKGDQGNASTIPGPPGSTVVEIATSIMGKIFPLETLFRINLTDTIELTPDKCFCDAACVLSGDVTLQITINNTNIGSILFPANAVDPITGTTIGIFQFATLSNIGPGALQIRTPTDVGTLADMSVTITGER